MIVLQSLKKAMQFVGLGFTYSDRLAYRIYRWTSFFILSMMFEPSCLYFIVNYNDIIIATELSVFVVAEGVTMAKVLFMIYNQKSIVFLLKDLQDMADKKVSSGRTKFLYKFHKEAEIISRSFIGMLGIASCIFIGGPAIAIFYRKYQRTYVPHMYGHPYKGYFPYDFETTPGYEVTYALNCIYNVYLASYFAACDLFLVNCGLHLIGAAQDLQEYFKEVDVVRNDEIMMTRPQQSSSTDPLSGYSDGISTSLVFQLNEGIKTHYRILLLRDTLASVVQGIIFSQFFGVIFSLSAIAFQVVSSEGEQRFFFIAPTLVILAQLFLYCFYGQRVADESTKLSESIYQLRWYNYPLKYQKYFQLIILRTQNSDYLSGLGFVKCSLESFADVLKFVGSVVALFRNLQN